jgi:Raf kinase inhibitor-like YbhB/YbcL family protein
MRLSSSAFKDGENIPSRFTCDGENISPALTFEDVPDSALSLVLIMEDPDVPKNLRPDGMWDHWVVFNVPPETPSFEEGVDPPGIVGLSTRNVNSYGGPCPPDGEHRYFFYLYAIDTMLDLPERSTKRQVLDAIDGHVIEKTKLMGKYIRI